jgi:hypothetical protein
MLGSDSAAAFFGNPEVMAAVIGDAGVIDYYDGGVLAGIGQFGSDPVGTIINPVVNRARTTYDIARQGGSSRTEAALLSGAVVASDVTGVTGIYEAYDGHPVLSPDVQLSTRSRIGRGAMGSVQLVLTAVGITAGIGSETVTSGSALARTEIGQSISSHAANRMDYSGDSIPIFQHYNVQIIPGTVYLFSNTTTFKTAYQYDAGYSGDRIPICQHDNVQDGL